MQGSFSSVAMQDFPLSFSSQFLHVFVTDMAACTEPCALPCKFYIVEVQIIPHHSGGDAHYRLTISGSQSSLRHHYSGSYTGTICCVNLHRKTIATDLNRKKD